MIFVNGTEIELTEDEIPTVIEQKEDENDE